MQIDYDGSNVIITLSTEGTLAQHKEHDKLIYGGYHASICVFSNVATVVAVPYLVKRLASDFPNASLSGTFEALLMTTDVLPEKVKWRPVEFKKTPKDFQIPGIDKILSNKRSMLAWEPGLGKTVAALYAAATIAAGNRDSGCLIICPAGTMLSTWVEEIKRCLPRAPYRLIIGDRGLNRVRGFTLISYNKLLLEWEKHPTSVAKWVGAFDLVVADETSLLNNRENKTYECLTNVLGDAVKTVFLNGTPIENAVGDFVAQMGVLSPGTLPPWASRWGPGDLIKATGHLLDAVRIKDVRPGAPSIDYVTCSVELSQCQIDMVKELESSDTDPIVVPTKLQQIIDDPALLGHGASSPKTEKLLDILPGITAWGEKVVVFTQYKRFAKRLSDEINRKYPGLSPVLHTGGMTAKDKLSAVRALLSGESSVFITTKAGGRGLNLDGVGSIVLMDQWPGAGFMRQMERRIYRLTTMKPINIVKMVADIPFELRRLSIVQSRQAMADSYMSEFAHKDI